MSLRKPQKRKVKVPWGDHVLRGQHRRTVAKRMRLKEWSAPKR